VSIEAGSLRSGRIQTAPVAGVEAVAGRQHPVGRKIDKRVAVRVTATEVAEIDFLSTEKDAHLITKGERRGPGKVSTGHGGSHLRVTDHLRRREQLSIAAGVIGGWVRAGDVLDRLV